MGNADPTGLPTAERTAERPSWLPLAVLAVAALVLLFVALELHTTPSYGSETDLIGDLIPAARSLRAGRILADNFQFKGPGYPLLLAAAGGALGGNDWLAARLVNVVSAGAAAWFAFLIAERFLSVWAGLFVMLGLFANPIWLRAAFEAGTDMPALAISMASTWLVLSRTGRGAWLGAGLLAGFSYLTRYNAIALVPAAVVVAVFGPPDLDGGRAKEAIGSRWMRLAFYAAGFGATVGAWTLASRAFATGVMRNLNYLNVAYEVYGSGMGWDNYWTVAAGQFHSIVDVLRFDPPRMARVLARNVGTRWWLDVHELMPLWIGIPAVLGMLATWPRRRGALSITAHFAFAYLALAGVFYAQRFFLYLIPFYLMGAAGLLFHRPKWPWAARRPAATPRPVATPPSRPRHRARADVSGAEKRRGPAAGARPWGSGRPWLSVGLGAGLIVVSGWGAFQEIRKMLDAAPYETRDAGELLKQLAPAGGRVMARKPHVAYFAGMEYVSIPPVESISALLTFAADQRVDYLLFTALEASLRTQFMLLADKDVSLPGLVQIAHRVYPSRHFYALYRFTKEPIDTAHFAQAVLDRATLYATRNPMDPRAQTFVGGLLFDYDRPREALRFLERSARLDPSNPRTLGLMAVCYFTTGDDVRAGRACEAAMQVADATATIHALLAVSRASAGRWDEARDIFQVASGMDPTNPRLLLQYGVTLLSTGNREAGTQALDRSVAFAPELGPFRERALRTFAGGGRADVALVLLHRIMHLTLFPADLRELARDWPG